MRPLWNSPDCWSRQLGNSRSKWKENVERSPARFLEGLVMICGERDGFPPPREQWRQGCGDGGRVALAGKGLRGLPERVMKALGVGIERVSHVLSLIGVAA